MKVGREGGTDINRSLRSFRAGSVSSHVQSQSTELDRCQPTLSIMCCLLRLSQPPPPTFLPPLLRFFLSLRGSDTSARHRGPHSPSHLPGRKALTGRQIRAKALKNEMINMLDLKGYGITYTRCHQLHRNISCLEQHTFLKGQSSLSSILLTVKT